MKAASDGRSALGLALIRAALRAVDARRCTAAALDRVRADGHALDGCAVIAFGKAAAGMAQAALERCAPREGVVLGFDDGRLGPLALRAAGHPLPAADAPARGREVLSLARSLGAGDVALCLISGGGSAMLELPAPGLAVEDLQRTTDLLLRAGATIDEVNAVRRDLSQLKGGRLAAALAPATVINVLISDVPGGDPSVVASGPTTADVSELDGVQVVGRLGLREQLPQAVRSALDAPPPAALPSAFADVHTYVAADNAVAQRAVVQAAARRGLSIRRHDEGSYAAGEAREVGRAFARAARERCAAEGIDGVVWGGETTVHVEGDGRGGRNHELVLGGAAEVGDGLLLSVGTDGIDGSSRAAGAFVDAAVLERARALGLDPEVHLRRNDADPFFRQAGGRIETGRTGTNVADVCLYLRAVR